MFQNKMVRHIGNDHLAFNADYDLYLAAALLTLLYVDGERPPRKDTLWSLGLLHRTSLFTKLTNLRMIVSIFA